MGDARQEVTPLLRRMAGGQMRAEPLGRPLQPTALVHEAFLRQVDQSQTGWQNRARFFGAAAQVMRRLLVDHERRRNAGKRGKPGGDRTEEILEPRQARVVELRNFAGLPLKETAEATGISVRTVKADWAMAEGWMRWQLQAERHS